MTDDNQLSFNLPSVSRKKVTAVFDGGRLSSDSGVMLLALADRRRAVADPQRRGERDRPQGRWRFHEHVNCVCLQYLHVAYKCKASYFVKIRLPLLLSASLRSRAGTRTLGAE
jgi:hypothetical protein